MTRTKPNTRLAELAADVRQLIQPIHLAHRSQIHTRPSLLDQLRTPPERRTTGHHGGGHTTPGSKPPIDETISDALATLYVGISGWHARLDLPSPPAYVYGCTHPTCHLALLERSHPGPACAAGSITRVDWHKAALRQLVGAWPNLSPGQQEWLAADVAEWWQIAAKTTGWKPNELRRLR